MSQVRYKCASVEGLNIFYREAGSPTNPVVLLLHGFPSSSFMFRDLIRQLSEDHYVIAPDYPGFGYSSIPKQSSHTFEKLADIVERFLELLSIDQFAMYIQDYGAPVGLRLALRRPESISGLIIQNGNAYEEGLSDEWLPLKRFWKNPTAEARESLRGWLTEDGVRMQYLAGIPEDRIPRFSPDTWTLDWSLLARPENIDMQLDLFHDYQTNVDMYPAFQQFFRDHQPPTLILWGERDPFFNVEGARAYLRDLPEAELHLIDGGHFLLESHAYDVGALILDHLKQNGGKDGYSFGSEER